MPAVGGAVPAHGAEARDLEPEGLMTLLVPGRRVGLEELAEERSAIAQWGLNPRWFGWGTARMMSGRRLVAAG